MKLLVRAFRKEANGINVTFLYKKCRSMQAACDRLIEALNGGAEFIIINRINKENKNEGV